MLITMNLLLKMSHWRKAEEEESVRLVDATSPESSPMLSVHHIIGSMTT